MAEISLLNRRMIEDMTVRNFSPATQLSYLNAASKFSSYFGRSPDGLSLEDVHAFQVHLVATGISWPALNQIVCALRDSWLSSCVFRSYENLVDHCCYAWNKFVDQPWRIMSIRLRDWAHGF